MRGSLAITGLAILCFTAGCSPPKAVDAATSSEYSPAVSASPSQNTVRQRIVAVTSPTASAVNLTWAESQFFVSIENSALNSSTHSARNSEAVTIADTIVAAVANMSEFVGVLGIHVEYVAREVGASKTRVIDSIDFRRDSSGRMTLHTT